MQEPIVQSIEMQSAALIQKLEGANVLVRAIRGKPEDNSNVRGLKQVVQEINLKGIDNWILVQQDSRFDANPAVETPGVMEDLAESLANILSSQP